MAPRGRLSADRAGTMQYEGPAEDASDSARQPVQAADERQLDHSEWQTPLQLEEIGRQTEAATGPAPSSAATLSQHPATTDATAADATADTADTAVVHSHYGMSTGYTEAAAGPDHDAYLVRCLAHLRTHWPAIIPILENHEQHIGPATRAVGTPQTE